MLEELKNFDTPSITNVVATYPESPLCLGLYNPWSENWYTDTRIRCMYPELGRRVGYAVTCVFSLPDPELRAFELPGCAGRAGGVAAADDFGHPAEVPAAAA